MRTTSLSCLVLLLAAGCGAPPKSSEGAQAAAAATDVPLPPAAQPWTDAFLERGLLVAQTVRIEGPPGLIAHFVGRVEEGVDTEVKTLPEGLRQTYSINGDVPGIELRAQLDQLSIVAERRIVVLERPGPVDVVVEAQGDVYYRDAAGKERREATLRLVGPLAP